MKFKDLNSDTRGTLPSLTMERVVFFSSYEKKYENFSKRTQKLYEDRYMSYVRSASNNPLSMYVRVTGRNEEDILQSRFCISREGVVAETQCEYAVGQDPYADCKYND